LSSTLPLTLSIEADECVAPNGDARDPYGEVLSTLLGDRRHLLEVRDATRRHFHERGITFGAPTSDDRMAAPIIPFDPLPRVLDSVEWQGLERALAQRAVALDTFVSDCYGSQRSLREGVVPASVVYSSTGYLRDIVGVQPPRATWCHVAGIDIVRIDGRFHVLEDNIRVPSGIAYALEARRALEMVTPEWFKRFQVEPIDEYTTRLRRVLQRIAPRPWEAALVVLTPGHFNAAYYEHELIAREMGGTLVEGIELIVHEEQLFRRDVTGHMQRVDVLYSRVNSEWLDPLVFQGESLLGSPGLIEAWRRGNVAIANAPGTGVADDKGVYPYVPAMIRYYLGEEPLLDNVPTFDLADNAQRAHVVASMSGMVLKPVDASGGYGIRFGRLMTTGERAEMARRLEAEPRAWLAQEEVRLSRALSVGDDGTLEPRAVDLRPFVLLDERPWIVPGGLTRVARDAESVVVNSSQGGGIKDTWVLHG
jgi:uncharacterized circularly permuted ATP-grasp superfamily protein